MLLLISLWKLDNRQTNSTFYENILYSKGKREREIGKRRWCTSALAPFFLSSCCFPTPESPVESTLCYLELEKRKKEKDWKSLHVLREWKKQRERDLATEGQTDSAPGIRNTENERARACERDRERGRGKIKEWWHGVINKYHIYFK